MVIRNHDLKRPTKIMNEFLFFFVCMLKHPCWKKHVVYDFFLFVFGPFFVVFVIIFFLLIFKIKVKACRTFSPLSFDCWGFTPTVQSVLFDGQFCFWTFLFFSSFYVSNSFLYVCKKKNENIFILFYVRFFSSLSMISILTLIPKFIILSGAIGGG